MINKDAFFIKTTSPDISESFSTDLVGLMQPCEHFAQATKMRQRLATSQEVFALFMDNHKCVIPAHNWMITSTLVANTSAGVYLIHRAIFDEKGMPILDEQGLPKSQTGECFLIENFPARRMRIEKLRDYPVIVKALTGMDIDSFDLILRKMIPIRNWAFFYGEMDAKVRPKKLSDIPGFLHGDNLNAVLPIDLPEQVLPEKYQQIYPVVVGSYAWDKSFGIGLTRMIGGYNQSALYVSN